MWRCGVAFCSWQCWTSYERSAWVACGQSFYVGLIAVLSVKLPKAEVCDFTWLQVCRQNPGEKGKYIKIIVALLAVRLCTKVIMFACQGKV